MDSNIIDRDLEIIKNFIYNDEVQMLLSKIMNSVKEFNIFEITGMQEQEIKHSNTLAWLFGDNEHGLDSRFFIEFLKKSIIATQSNSDYYDNLIVEINKLREYIYLSNRKKELEVRREYNNIDIVVIDQNNKHVFLIENKIYSSEEEKQLYTYFNNIEKEFNNYKRYYIYLTKDLLEPRLDLKNNNVVRQNYLLCSYKEIVEIIDELIELNINGILSIKDETILILESYKDLLIRRGIVDNDPIQELCNKIWANPKYREALEILINNKPNIISDCLDRVLEKDKEIIRLDKYGTKRRTFTFKSFDKHPMIQSLHANVDVGRFSGVWKDRAIVFRINIEDDKLEWCLILKSKTNKDQQLVEEFLEKISNIKGIRKGNKSYLTGWKNLCKFDYDEIREMENGNNQKIENKIKEGIKNIKTLADAIIVELDK